MKKLFLKIFTAILLTVAFLCNAVSVGECREVVFVVNSSQSMTNSDPQKRIAEGVAWGIANLEPDDEAAVISFNDTTQVLRPLTKVSAHPNQIFNLNYTGNSNAGDALLAAVDMLADKFETDRRIFFITDGEISLADSMETLRSVEKFKDGLKQASQANMQVYILNLRYQGNPKNYHSYVDLANEFPIPHGEFMTTLRTIFYDDFHKSFVNLPVNNGIFPASIPLKYFDKIKMFVLSSNPGTTELKSMNKRPVLNGNFVKCFEINSPQTNNFDFLLKYPANTGLTFDATASVEGILQTEVETHLFSADTLTITPAYKNNPAEKIFADDYFEKKSVRLVVNDKEIKSAIHNGAIKIDLPSEKNITLKKVYFEDLGVDYNGDTSATFTLQGGNYLIYVLAGLAILAILILFFFVRSKEEEKIEEKTAPPPPPVKQVEKLPEVTEIELPEEVIEPPKPQEKATFNGKLAIYVTKTENDEDIAPREFNLFRFGKGVMSLSTILAECKIAEHFQNIGDIFISPSKRGIYLANNSDSTILKRGHLIERGKQTELYYEDSVSITVPDETAELILRYKSLKPMN